MERPSKNECDTLSDIAKSFSTNVVQASGMSTETALSAFGQNASMLDKVRLVTSKALYLLVPAMFYRVRARLLVGNCERALPVLERTFGESTLVEAMRAVPSRSEVLANRVESFGGAKIAALIRKSL
jgi:hypothetical protein